MSLIYDLLSCALLLLNLAGLTALATRILPYPAIARAGSVLLLCLCFFFVEHFEGLGHLNWLWPITSAGAAALLYQQRHRLRAEKFWQSEIVLLLAFGYALMWRWLFPDIYPSSERVTDLFFIGNYYAGETLPPLNHWDPATRFDFYYAFQHYAASLMGRILGLDPGRCYQLGFALLMGLSVSLAWDFVARFLPARALRALVIATLLIGGTGASPLIHALYQPALGADSSYDINMGLWSSARFIGGFDQKVSSAFLVPTPHGPQPSLDLPAETFGYQYYVGDYHPPLGGFFLLMLAIALIGLLESPHKTQEKTLRGEALCQALLALTVPATLATNTWTLPPQILLVVSWVLWRYLTRRPLHWGALIAGGLGGALLLYPFLTGFTAKTLVTPIKLVTQQQHTPLLNFLALHWPLLTLFLLGAGQGVRNREGRRFFILFSLAFAVVLLLAEFIYIDDPTGGHFDRSNTTMKWWGWVWTGLPLTLGTFLLASPQRWRRRVTIVVLLLVNVYAIDMGRYLLLADKGSAGHLAGDQTYVRDSVMRDMFRYLKQAPDGIVLENIYRDAFTDSGVYALFAVKPVLLGWPSHLVTWTGGNSRIWLLKAQIQSFYAGQMSNPLNWLAGQNVRYIIWTGEDDLEQPAESWGAINKAISDQYQWVDFLGIDNTRHTGLWVRVSGQTMLSQP